MFNSINNLLNLANAKNPRQEVEQEPSQSITNTTDQTQLSVATSLPSTTDKVRQIQANLASNTRAEFASVIDQLNASQGKNTNSN